MILQDSGSTFDQNQVRTEKRMMKDNIIFLFTSRS